MRRRAWSPHALRGSFRGGGSSMKRKYGEAGAFLVCHALAALAFFPWFFSWTGVVLLVVGCYVFGALGINLCFHRLITHRSFSCPRWLEHAFVVIAVCSVQDSPAHWAAVHRRHHHFADDERDPHSPIVSFFWAHMGWLLVKSDDMKRGPLMERYAKDILRDPFYAWLEQHNNWLKIALLSWLAYFVVGFGVAWLSGASVADATQFGLSLFIWGAVLRTVVVWHLTWSVNSVTHIWGYRNYDTPGRQPQQRDRRAAGQRRRLAQQPSRRSELGATRSQVVGARSGLAGDPPVDVARARQGCRPAVSASRRPVQFASGVDRRSRGSGRQELTGRPPAVPRG